jgi:protein subunit release factor B
LLKQMVQESSNQWSEKAGQIVDRLTGENMSMTCAFQRFTIDVPRAEGPGGQYIGSVQWIINGRIVSPEPKRMIRNSR